MSIARWFDNDAPGHRHDNDARVDWARVLPFLVIHAGSLGVVWVGVSATAAWIAFGLYLTRMFAITGFYHRYFSHRSFRASRAMQFVFAFAGATAAQRGPLWWASHHRHHHLHADKEEDAHSPHHHGFLWSHAAWFLSQRNFAPRLDLIGDFARFPELRFLDRFDWIAPTSLIATLYALGAWLEVAHPGLKTSGEQLVVWGFCISTVCLYHATFTVNSLAHSIGRRRYATRDQSRNNWLLALLTLGEGWHNNHHHYPGAARQGFFWWEIDITWYALRLMAAFKLVRELRGVPAEMLNARGVCHGTQS